MSRGPRIAVALAVALLAACAGPGFHWEDLPEAPIALLYRTPEDAERVAEALARRREAEIPEVPGEKRIHLEDVGRLFGLATSEDERAASLLGRLAFLDPRRQEIVLAEFANRGARPLGWSPDRSKLLFLGFRRDTSQVFEWDRTTEAVLQVTSGPDDAVDASYGPDGALVFSRRTPDGFRIFVREPGERPRAISPGPADYRPAWSPDGALIAYQTLDESGSEAVAATAVRDGGERRVLARGRSPAFTPDGEWIVFSARTRDGWKIWRMRPDGSARRPVGRGPGDENDPTVSPDGRWVAFVTPGRRGGRQQIMVRSLDGSSGDRPLLSEGEGLLPHW